MVERRVWTEEKLKEMQEVANKASCAKEVARHFDVSTASVYYKLNDLRARGWDIKKFTDGNHKQRKPEELLERKKLQQENNKKPHKIKGPSKKEQADKRKWMTEQQYVIEARDSGFF